MIGIFIVRNADVVYDPLFDPLILAAIIMSTHALVVRDIHQAIGTAQGPPVSPPRKGGNLMFLLVTFLLAIILLLVAFRKEKGVDMVSFT